MKQKKEAVEAAAVLLQQLPNLIVPLRHIASLRYAVHEALSILEMDNPGQLGEYTEAPPYEGIGGEWLDGYLDKEQKTQKKKKAKR